MNDVAPQLPPDQGVVEIRFRPDVGEFDLFESGATEPYAITGPETSKPEVIANTAEFLTRLMVEVGPGDHISAEVAKQLGLPIRSFTSRVIVLASILPAEVISYHRSAPKAPTMIRIGNVTVRDASDPVRPEEQEARAALRAATKRQISERGPSMAAREREETFRRVKDGLERQDASKIDLTARDHAVVRIGEDERFIMLDSPMSMVLARFVAALTKFRGGERTPVGRKLDLDELRYFIWDQMSLAERRLLVREEDDIYRRSSYRYIRFGRIIRALKNIKVGQKPLINDEYFQGAIVVPFGVSTVALPKKAPPDTPYEFKQLVLPPRLGAAPQSSPASATELEIVVPTASDLDTARTWQSRLAERDHFGQREAVELLDFVMTPLGKESLRRVLPPDASGEAFEELLERAHRRVRYALGNLAYWPAWRQRLIAGSTTTHGDAGIARQVGGRLEGSETKEGFGDDARAPR